MARRQAIFPEVNFVNGLVTETTALRFPENACTETWNCDFDYTGRVRRRLGVDTEVNYVFQTVEAADPDNAYSEFLWETVGTQGTASFFVVQRGRELFFYDSSETTDYATTGTPNQVIDLNDHLSEPSQDPNLYRCSFAEGRGHLIVVNPAINPIFISYNEATQVLEAEEITIRFRDFLGLDDGLGLNERVTESVATLKTNNPEHYYNLLNQGWHIGDALSQWDTARTDMPSNADIVSFYRASSTDLFDNTRVNSTTSGVNNTPGPKGHFILDAGSPSRNDAMTAEGFTGAVVPDPTIGPIDLTGLTTIGSNPTRTSNSFDGNTSQNKSQSTQFDNNDWIGKTLTTGTPIYGAVLTTSTQGAPLSTATLYAKTGAAPASRTDGTVIGTISWSSVFNKRSFVIYSTDTTTAYDHVWVSLTKSGAEDISIAEVQFLTGSETFYRPSLVAFYAGRTFYAGLPNQGNSNSIYFSQLLERNEQYGQCYQKNDPTDETYFDLLSDDGGVIVIPEIGRIINLYAQQSTLIVFATNGVWIISGSNRGPFQATDYSVRKISSVGTNSRTSLVDRRGTPIWWAEDGIYSVQFNPNYDTFEVVSLTEQTIKTFIQSIPKENRRHVKGTYDRDNDILMWIYTDTPYNSSADYYNYNKVLCMNGVTKAFYPWELGVEDIYIKGIMHVRDVEGQATSKVKLVLEHSNGTQLTFGEFRNNTTWSDWHDFAISVADPTQEVDYQSYFISAYKVHGETQKFFQINYIFVFMEEEQDASLHVQAIHDFTSSPNTGKWSTPQQCYQSTHGNRDVRYRRLKVRGKGKAIQLKMYSTSGMPFTCIGWSTNESVNGEI